MNKGLDVNSLRDPMIPKTPELKETPYREVGRVREAPVEEATEEELKLLGLCP